MVADTPVQDPTLPALLSVRDLASYLGVPVSTIYLWRSSGRGPHGFKVGKQIRFREADVMEWLNDRNGGSP